MVTNKGKKQPDPVDLHVASQLKRFREDARVTQEQLAARLGITFQQVQKYEKGINRITLGRFFEITKALQLPVDRFFAEYGTEPAVLGFAEDEPAAYVAEPPKLESDLLDAFRSIPDETLRRSIVELLAAVSRRDNADRA